MAYPSSWSDGIRMRFDSQHRWFSPRHGIPVGSWARSAFNAVTTPINYSRWSAAISTEIHTVVRTFHPVERIAGDWSASDREYMESSEGFYTGDCLREVSRRPYYCRLSSLVASRQEESTHFMWACRHVAFSMATRNIYTLKVTKNL